MLAQPDYRAALLNSGGARTLEQVVPAAGPKIVYDRASNCLG